MNMNMEEVVYQNTLEWKLKRIGKVTASRVKDIMPLKSGKYSTKRETYLRECVVGRFGVIPDDIYVSKEMAHGIETEPLARAVYEQLRDLKLGEISEIDIINHPSIPNFSASPDGLVGSEGMLEIKCPTSQTHLEYILDGVVPDEYVYQMATQLACSGRKWVDFFSFDNRIPNDKLHHFLIRYERDESLIKEIEYEVIKFNSEVYEKINAIAERIGK